MPDEISKDKLPSKIYYKELQEYIHYKDIEDILKSIKEISSSGEWTSNFSKYAEKYTDKYPENDSRNNSSKRCRDLIYILNVIKWEINKSSKFEGTQEIINSTIDNYISSFLTPLGYENCYIKLSTESEVIKNKKILDDLCEDVDYVQKNTKQINSSEKCNEIREYISEQITSAKSKNMFSSAEYSDILGYYKFSSDNFDNITQKVHCTDSSNSESLSELQHQSGTSKNTGKEMSISITLSLLGIMFICFLLYKITPIGPWLNEVIKKKLKLGNNRSDDISQELFGDIFVSSQKKSHKELYEISYNSLDDS
ncbi:PIR Superfamily Protein [Plasmodium ovale wallikeri]|uniref:PIR Superfamily Protein n=1 Tax=Plasmodium ovale wallikeri TaxID=864142 RepID=A0A1A9ARX8_PLAOA|nr:PIR Superfamily Protein [Plasmodium ovale wallikeri]SBT58976.1 PIR Superfamily Protein [Plasmodium ovale wallikeri]